MHAYGPQTNIGRDVNGPVLSGVFNAPVTVDARVSARRQSSLCSAIIDPRPVFERVAVEDFVGRRWLIAAIDDFLEEEDRGLFVLEAPAGVGKTSFMAHLVKKRGYVNHFAEMAPGFDGIVPALRNIAAQLIYKWGPERNLKAHSLTLDRTNPTFLASYLENLLFALAERRDSECPLEKIVVVIDALDEAGVLPAHNVLGLPRSLPEGVYFIVSQRPIAVPLTLEAPRRVFHLRSDATPNLLDMETYLLQCVKQAALSQILEERGYDPESFLRVLMEKSAGVWIYMHYLIEQFRSGKNASCELAALPSNLWQYYARYWRRWRDRDDWEGLYLPLLAALGVTQEPRLVRQLCDLIGSSRYGEVERLFRERWRAFLWVEKRSSGTYYDVYHTSLRQFISGQVSHGNLAEAEKYVAEEMADAARNVHQRIVDYYAWDPSRWLEDDGYAFRHLHLHSAIASPDYLQDLVENKAWFVAQQNYDPTLGGYAKGVDYALSLARQGGSQEITRYIAYTLLRSTIGSLATTVSPGILEALTLMGQTKQAISYAELTVDPVKKLDGLLRIVEALSGPDSDALCRQILDSALQTLALISNEYRFEERAESLATALVQRAHWRGLRRLLDTLDRLHVERKVKHIIRIARTIIDAGEWSILCEVIDVLEAIAYPSSLPDYLLEIITTLTDLGHSQHARLLLAKAEQHTEALKRSGVLARVSYHWRVLGEVERAERVLDQAVAVLEEIDSVDSRAQALLDLSRAVEDDRRQTWLHQAVEVLQEGCCYSPYGSLVGELGEALAKDGTSDDLEALYDVVAKGFAERSSEYWKFKEQLAEPITHRLGLEFLTTDLDEARWDSRSRIVVKAIYGIAARPNRRDVNALFHLVTQMDDDDPYFGEAVEALTPIAVQLNMPTVIIGLLDKAVGYRETRTMFQKQAWKALASALVELKIILEVEEWCDVLRRIERTESHRVAWLNITQALIGAGSVRVPIEIAKEQRYALGDNPEVQLGFSLARGGFLDEAWCVLSSIDSSSISEGIYWNNYALCELARQADVRNRIDILQSLADQALKIDDTRFLDVIAPLLVKAGLVPQAIKVVQAYKRTAHEFGNGQARSEGRVALIDALAQAGKFPVAQAYAKRIEASYREKALKRISRCMASSPNIEQRREACQLVTSIRDREVQASALSYVTFGLAKLRDYVAIADLLRNDALTWYVHRGPDLAEAIVGTLARGDQFELAAQLVCVFMTHRHGKVWKPLLKSIIAKEEIEILPTIVAKMLGEDSVSDLPWYLSRDNYYQSMDCARKAEVRVQMASMIGEHDCDLVRRLVTSAKELVDKIEEDYRRQELNVKIVEVLAKVGDLRAALALANEVEDDSQYISLMLMMAEKASRLSHPGIARTALRRARDKLESGYHDHSHMFPEVSDGGAMWLWCQLSRVAHCVGEDSVAVDSLSAVWRLGSEPLQDFRRADAFLYFAKCSSQWVDTAMQLGLEQQAWSSIDSQVAALDDRQVLLANRHSFVEALDVLFQTVIRWEAWDHWSLLLRASQQVYIYEQVELLGRILDRLDERGFHERVAEVSSHLEEILRSFVSEETSLYAWQSIVRAISGSKYLVEHLAVYFDLAVEQALIPEFTQRDEVRSYFDSLTDLALLSARNGHRDQAMVALSRIMEVVQEERIGRAAWRTWPDFFKLLDLIDTPNAWFEALTLAQYMDEGYAAEYLQELVPLALQLVSRYPERSAEVIHVLLQQASDQGRVEVWKHIKALVPILLALGGWKQIVETWEYLDSIQELVATASPC